MVKAGNYISLATTAQALSITSQLLAIGIEVGIIAGGILLYKKLTEKPEPEKEHNAVLIPEGMKLVPVEQKGTSFKEKWAKAKKIFLTIVG